MFHGNGEHIAARHDGHPFAARAEAETLDIVGGVDRLGAGRGGIRRHDDGQRTVPAVAGIVDMQFAVRLVHDLALGVCAGPAHIPILVVRQLLGPARRDVVAVQIEYARAVGIEIDGIADPHRVAIGTRVVRDLQQRRMRQIENKQIICPAALVALFAAKIAPQGRVHDLLAVGRKLACARDRHGQRRRGASAHRYRVELGVRQYESVARGSEQHSLAIRSPAVDLIVVTPTIGERARGGIVGELPRGAAVRGNHVHLFVAAVLARERDEAPIGGELRE